MKNSSQQFIPITDIKNDLVFLKDGGVSMVLSTSAVNFGLLFETEQMSIIESFAGLLNSLSFPIQIVIHSKRLDVSSYLKTIDKALTKQTNPLLKNMTLYYRDFVASIIKDNNVLDKQFYVCLTISATELGVLPKNFQEKSNRAAIVLAPRRDHLLRQLGRLNLKAWQMSTVELVRLFYNIYNPPYNDPETIKSLDPAEPVPEKKEIKETVIMPIQQTVSPPPPPVIPVPQPSSPPMNSHPIPPNFPPQTTVTPTQLAPPFVVEELSDDIGN